MVTRDYNMTEFTPQHILNEMTKLGNEVKLKFQKEYKPFLFDKLFFSPKNEKKNNYKL